MVSRDGAFGILMGATVGTLFLVPAHSSAQDSLSVSCVSVQFLSPLEDLTRCAEEGDAKAQSSLGLRYYAGGGPVPLDYAKAVRWFRLAAEQGHADAQVMLGLMSAEGLGVPKDDAKALQWYLIAAEQGDASAAADGLEAVWRSRDRIQQRMTPEQIAEAERLSRVWMEAHPPDGGN